MTQFLRPLYGEYITDASVAHAIPLPPGVYAGMVPSIAGAGGASGWTASLSPDADGFSYWRTPGNPSVGRYVIQETAAVQLPIEGSDAKPRIDLIIGLHKWVAGSVDPGSFEPFGTYPVEQQATYAVVKGTPADSPVEPTIPDPYNAGGVRAVILAKVSVPASGAATIARYDATDLRLAYMRAVTQEVTKSRGGFPGLPERLDSMAIALLDKINAVAFKGVSANTGALSTYQKIPLATTSKYGSVVTMADSYNVSLTVPGLYEIEGFHKLEGQDISSNNVCSSLRLWLKRDGASDQLLDTHGDTGMAEISQAVYAMVYVDPAWTGVSVYIERSGWPAGVLRGSAKYLGNPTTLDALGIVTGNLSFTAVTGQTYPDSAIVTLQALNAVGATSWSIVSGSGLLDGSSSPKAEIVNGNQLKLTWATTPTYPDTHSVKLQVVDSATPYRVASKTITVTLAAAGALSIDNADVSLTAYSYPYAVSLQGIASGGASPFTWALVAGVDTTLPGAAISGATVTGSVSAAGTWKVRLRCTDSNSTQVEKVVNIAVATGTSGGGGGGSTGCVPAGTGFSTVDGVIPIEDVVVGTMARGYDESCTRMIEAKVTRVFVYEDRPLVELVTDKGSLVCSRDHRPWRRDARPTRVDHPNFPPVEEMVPGDVTMIELAPGLVDHATVLEVRDLHQTETVYHVTLEHGHVYVAGGFPAHNAIKQASME